MASVAFSRGEKMWYVDREWLVRFGVCMMHQGGDTAVAVDTCIRLTGEEMSGSRSEGLPDKREGDAVEASPDTDRITPVNGLLIREEITRITRTFSPSEAGSDAEIPDQTHHADGVPVDRT